MSSFQNDDEVKKAIFNGAVGMMKEVDPNFNPTTMPAPTELQFFQRHKGLCGSEYPEANFKNDLVDQIWVAAYFESQVTYLNVSDTDKNFFKFYKENGLVDNPAALLKNIANINDGLETDDERRLQIAVTLLHAYGSWEKLTTDIKNTIASKVKVINPTDGNGVNFVKWKGVADHVNNQNLATNNYFSTQQPYYPYQNHQHYPYSSPPNFMQQANYWQNAFHTWWKDNLLPGVPPPGPSNGLHPDLTSKPLELVGPILVALATGQPLAYENQLMFRSLFLKNTNFV